VEAIIDRLKDAIVDSGAIELLVLKRSMEVVWFNETLAGNVGSLADHVGKRCFETFANDSEPHEGCTARKAFDSGSAHVAIEKMGDDRYLVVAIPLDEDHVGEVIAKLPQEVPDD
jgi:hypothetical protein